MSIAVKTSLLVLACISVATFVHGKANPSQVVSYLETYGYLPPLDPTNGKLRSNDELIEAVKKLQRMGGKPETGKLDDPDLLALIDQPRCGMPDVGPSDNARRKRRYTLQGSRWHKKDLTYKILNYTPDLKKEEVEQTIQAALNEWAKVTSLTFTRVTSNAKVDINIKFVTGSHGDGYPFDGPGGTLAHAFYPADNTREIYGDAHFDDHEVFTLKTNRGIDLFWVAVHEFGHSLGLDHSRVFDALMYPYYRGYTPNFKLNEDDIRGIQTLYGPPRKPGSKTTTPVPEPATPTPHTRTEKPNVAKKCNTTMDAFVMSPDGVSYAFKGAYFWPIREAYGAWTSALKIRDFWPKLEDNIDAAFLRRTDNAIFIIKGDKYWKFTGGRGPLLANLPISDSELKLPKELASPDAAFQWDRNGKIYFFKGTQYWRYDPTRKVIDFGYPRPIQSGWKGAIADNIDAAMQWKNRKSYFFKGPNYTALDDYSLTIPTVKPSSPPYPRNIGKFWMACSDSGEYQGGKILPDTSSVAAFIPNIVILVSSLVLTLSF